MIVQSIRRAFRPRNLASTALITLSVAGVAAAAIGSSQITNNSISGLDLKNNSVGTADIQNNSLISGDIKNGGLLGRDLKNSSVTGNQVDESTFAKVPTATAADTATDATNATRAASAAKVDGLLPVNLSVAASDQSGAASFAAAQAAAPSTTLAAKGALTIYTKCFFYSGDVYAYEFISTSQNGAIVDSDSDDHTGGNLVTDFLNTDTLENNRVLNNVSATSGTSLYGSHSVEFSAAAADGTRLMGSIPLAAKQSELTAGNGAYGAGNNCQFWGFVQG